jgi:predicted DsbA family dithiol-disulfide isomerase
VQSLITSDNVPESKVQLNTGAEMKIPFFYDYTCPWAYIGSARVETYFASQGVKIDFKPVYLKQMRSR